VKATGNWTGGREIDVGWNGQYPAPRPLAGVEAKRCQKETWARYPSPSVLQVVYTQCMAPCVARVLDSPIYTQPFVQTECIMSSFFCGLHRTEQLYDGWNSNPETIFSNSSKPTNPKKILSTCAVSVGTPSEKYQERCSAILLIHFQFSP
jgi:hypothetical protein